MKLALAAEGEWELGSLPDPEADDSVGRVLIERIVTGTYPARGITWHRLKVGSSRVDLQACKLEYSIVSPK